MKKETLAIVVPAYKPQFFKAALDSIMAQTNRDFTCYIFDDAAPKEIKAIADCYPDFHYTRFNENMGGHDLVGHWHRCLETIDEEWVWLFSDDDVMDINCVDEFYKYRKLYPNAAVFRFPADVIDANGQVIRARKTLKNESGLEFLRSRLQGTDSFMQDHIFNWKTLKETNGGFVRFPLAWCSDDATWCLLGKEHDIIVISSAIVQWRRSGMNITSVENTEASKIKIYAWGLFYLWCSKNFNLPLSYKIGFFMFFVKRSGTIPYRSFFQSFVFRCPMLILVILLMPIRKSYTKLRRMAGLIRNVDVSESKP